MLKCESIECLNQYSLSLFFKYVNPSKFLYRSLHAYPYNSPSSFVQVDYDIEEMNNNVIINGGIFVCTYEGLYHFTANIYGTYEEISPDNDNMGLHILVNGKNAAYNRRYNDRKLVAL